MSAQEVCPNVFSYTSAMNACEKSGCWNVALELLQSMHLEHVSPNSFTYSSAISSCGKAQRWQHALALFEQVSIMRLVPDVVTYNATISASEKGGKWEVALHLLLDKVSRVLFFFFLFFCGFDALATEPWNGCLKPPQIWLSQHRTK